MARKKKENNQRPPDYWTNPYYREEEEKKKKLDPNRSRYYTNLLMPLGALGGLALGILMQNLFIGTIFGFVLGIIIGTQLDLKFPRPTGKRNRDEDDPS